jgi:hypothetical protein
MEAVVWPGALLPALLSSGFGFGFMFGGGRWLQAAGLVSGWVGRGLWRLA